MECLAVKEGVLPFFLIFYQGWKFSSVIGIASFCKKAFSFISLWRFDHNNSRWSP